MRFSAATVRNESLQNTHLRVPIPTASSFEEVFSVRTTTESIPSVSDAVGSIMVTMPPAIMDNDLATYGSEASAFRNPLHDHGRQHGDRRGHPRGGGQGTGGSGSKG